MTRPVMGFLAPARPAKLDEMKVSDVLKLLHQDSSWYTVKSRGGDRQFKHPTKPGRVTVSGKPSDEMPPGTLNSVLKQARLRE